jgi:hypothetical protein
MKSVKITTDGRAVIDGRDIFRFRCSIGLPLEMMIDRALADGCAIDWAGFIDAARADGWWDFRTLDVIGYAIDETLLSPSERAAYKDGVMDGARRYVTMRRHPMMGEVTR